MADPVRLAIVGCGRIAQVAHLPAAEKAQGVELVAICDPSGEVAGSVARRYGVGAAYTDQRSVWADPSVEAVLVAAPDRFHHQIASGALAAGRHVLVEKPLTATVPEAEDLVGQVDRTGLTLQVGAMKRHDAGVRYARRFIAERVGEVRSFSAWYRIGDLRPGIQATLFPPVVADPAARRRAAAGKADRQRYLLATHGAHLFDTVRFLVGEVASLAARHRQDGPDHVWQALVTTTAGAVGTVTIAADVPGLPTEGIEVLGATGAVRADLHFPFYRRAATVHAYADVPPGDPRRGRRRGRPGRLRPRALELRRHRPGHPGRRRRRGAGRRRPAGLDSAGLGIPSVSATYNVIHPDADRRAAQTAQAVRLIGLAPEPGNVVRDARRAARLLAELGPGAPVGIILDPANLLSPGTAARQPEILAEAVDLLGPSVLGVQAKDVVAGAGLMDWPEVFGHLARLPPVPLIVQDAAEDDAARVRDDLLRWHRQAGQVTAG